MAPHRRPLVGHPRPPHGPYQYDLSLPAVETVGRTVFAEGLGPIAAALPRHDHRGRAPKPVRAMLGAVAGVLSVAALVGAAVAPAANAAPAPRCVSPNVVKLGGAGGGCDGYGGGGHDRLVVQCNGLRGTISYISGAWMHRNQSWYYWVWCPGGYGYRAVAAWYEHVNW